MITLLLDVDGCLCDFLGGLLSCLNRERGTAYRPQDCDRWDIAEAYGLTWKDLTPIVETPGFCLTLDPMPGAVEAVEALDLRADVYCVTSPFSGLHWMPERAQWLRKWLHMDKSHVIHCYTKRLIHGDVLVDDKPETIVDWANAWPTSTALLWDAPYNQGVALPANARRVRTWAEVIDVCR